MEKRKKDVTVSDQDGQSSCVVGIGSGLTSNDLSAAAVDVLKED